MKLNEYSKPAFKTALYFFIFGFFWILLSDTVVNTISISTQMEQQLQTYKGWFFILITTILIYTVVKQQIKLVLNLQNKLVLSEQRYKKIVTITQDLVWTTDTKGIITFINEASKEIFGLNPDEIIGKPLVNFVPEDQYKHNLEAMIQKKQNGEKTVVFESDIKHADGKKIFLKNTVSVKFDRAGNMSSFEGVSSDITAYKNYEQKLIESKERLELAMYGGEIGLWEFWFDSQKLIINEHWNKILGFHFENNEISFSGIKKLVHPEDRGALIKAYLKPDSSNNKYLEAEFRIKHADGSYRWVTSKGKVAEWNGKRPFRIMGAVMDSTEKKELELELKNLVNIYSSFISYSSEGIYLFEMNEPMPTTLPIEEQINKLYHDGYIRTCNDAFARMYGYEKASEMEGKDQQTLHGSDDDPKNIDLLRRFIMSDYRIMNDITKEIDKDGNTLYISNNVVGICENGKLFRTWGSQKDITGQVIAQHKIEESEKRYRLLFETNPVPLVIFDKETFSVHDVNLAMAKMLGYSKDEIKAMTLRDLRPDISESTHNELNELLKKEITQTTEIRIKSKSGKIIPCEAKFDNIKYTGYTAILGALNDLTAIKNAEKLVIQSLIEGADNERNRVSKEIHDSLGQSLTAASLNLNAIKSKAGQFGKKDAERFDLGLKFLRSAIEESRNIAHNLMPKAIEDFGIILSLKSLFNQIEKSTGLKINFYENMGTQVRPDIQTELNLFRITQEALNNVIKHAEASEVFVQLMLHPNEIIYTFEDDGKGFDTLILNSGKKGIGLKSIYNRAKAMSGHCDIDSAPNSGTTITIVIPV